MEEVSARWMIYTRVLSRHRLYPMACVYLYIHVYKRACDVPIFLATALPAAGFLYIEKRGPSGRERGMAPSARVGMIHAISSPPVFASAPALTVRKIFGPHASMRPVKQNDPDAHHTIYLFTPPYFEIIFFHRTPTFRLADTKLPGHSLAGTADF